MVDTETDYLRADFLYLSLFKRCSIIIRPYVLPRKLEGLMNILDIFYQIEHFDTENMDMLYEEENLELLMEHYATSGNGGSEALTGNEKPTFLFLPQVTKDMHPTLAKFPEVGFLAIQLMGSKNEIPTEAYERVALYDKKRGKIAKLKPASLLDEQSKKDPRYEWCEQVIGMCKASSLVSSSGSSSGNPSSPTSGNSSDSSPDGSQNNSKGSGVAGEVFEYLLSLKDTVNGIYPLMAGEFDEMDFYAGLKDFSASERLIVFSLLERLYNIRIFDGPLGDPEQKFTTIHRKIEDSKNHVTKKKENEEENTDNHRFQDESFLNTTRSKKVAAHKSVEHRGLSTKGEEEAYLREFTEISLISNSFFIAFQSVLAKIPSCGEIITPNETYQALRKTLWGNGIPEEFIAEVFRLYLTEKYKEGGLPRRDLLQREIYEISNVLKEFSPPLRVKAISEVVLSSILNKKSRNSIPFNFPETYNRNLARYREKFQVSENSDGEEWDEILHAIQNEKEYLISNLIALLKKSSSP